MSLGTITVSNEQLSTTMYVLMKEWRDVVGYTTAFLDAHERVHGKGGPSQAGGTKIVVPLGIGEHSKTTRMRTGFEYIDLSVSDVFIPAQYDWGSIRRPVAISSEEEFVNQGEAAVLSILEGRTKMTANALRREFVKQMVVGGVPGWEDWNTLNGVDYVTGFLENRASGTQSNSVGGVSKATYSSKPGWQNQAYDGLGSFNLNGLAGLYDIKVEMKSLSGGDMAGKVILGSRAGFKNLKRSLNAYERYVDQTKIDGGRMVEYWDGTQIEVEHDMPNAGTLSTADPVSFIFLDMNDIHCIFDPKGFFDMTPFETVSGNYEVRSAKIRCRGQLVAQALGSSAIAYDLEAF